MKLSLAPIVAALQAQGLPLAEEAAIKAVDAVLSSIQSQAAAQPGDLVANLVNLSIEGLQPEVDSELARLLPAAQA